MPYAVYCGDTILCPWPGCGFRIELIDFQLETINDPTFYALVMSHWGHQSDYGLIGRCPDCRQFVRYGLTEKNIVADPAQTILPILPDDWDLFICLH